MKRVLISFLFLFLCGHAPTLIAQMPTLLEPMTRTAG